MEMITIDGSRGEGGGQILRSSLALSLVTGQAFRMVRIRAGRKQPGLRRQHLAAVQAAAKVGHGQVTGATAGSQEIMFVPGDARPGEHVFAIGTAGSTTLVLQTILPPLLCATEPSAITLEGGTHNPFAPPFDFLERVFLPQINRMGPTVTARLQQPGFFPAGGGAFSVRIQPAEKLAPFDLLERGDVRRMHAVAWIAHLPRHIAQRELDTIHSELELEPDAAEIREVPQSRGPGNAVSVQVDADHVVELFTGFGQRGVPAEKVAGNVVRAVQEYLDANIPVGKHLADQLLLPLALAGGGSFRTQALSRHAETNIAVIQTFLDCRIEAEELHDGSTRVRVATD